VWTERTVVKKLNLLVHPVTSRLLKVNGGNVDKLMASLTDQWYYPRVRDNTAHGTGGRGGPGAGLVAVENGEISVIENKS
jgi:hypothetical protein